MGNDDPDTGGEENCFELNLSPEEEETPEDDLDASVVELDEGVEKAVAQNDTLPAVADEIEDDLDASIVEVGQEEGEEESDWTDRCAYECRLCHPSEVGARLEGKTNFTYHIQSAHNYTFER